MTFDKVGRSKKAQFFSEDRAHAYTNHSNCTPIFVDGNAIYDAPIYGHIDFLKNPILFSVYVFAAVFLAKFNQFVRV